MEVVEHVADVARLRRLAASLIRPGGLFALSTLNRTAKSFALAIVGAEYVLRWLAPGTHRWEQFVTPRRIGGGAARGRASGDRAAQGWATIRCGGDWRLSQDLAVNYFMAARKG